VLVALSANTVQREHDKFVEDGSGDTAVRTLISAGDIEIGAVEIKDASSDTRATVDSDGLYISTQANKLAGAPLVNQTAIASTGVAVQLPSNTLVNGVIVTAGNGNAAAISIGTSGVNNTVDGTGNGYVLGAGSSVSFAVSNTNLLYINGTSGDFVSFAGS
jgi:hypothetical protein